MAFARLALKSSSSITEEGEEGEEGEEDEDGGEGFGGLDGGRRSSLDVRIDASELGELCSCLEGGSCVLKA